MQNENEETGPSTDSEMTAMQRTLVHQAVLNCEALRISIESGERPSLELGEALEDVANGYLDCAEDVRQGRALL